MRIQAHACGGPPGIPPSVPGQDACGAGGTEKEREVRQAAGQVCVKHPPRGQAAAVLGSPGCPGLGGRGANVCSPTTTQINGDRPLWRALQTSGRAGCAHAWPRNCGTGRTAQSTAQPGTCSKPALACPTLSGPQCLLRGSVG